MNVVDPIGRKQTRTEQIRMFSGIFGSEHVKQHELIGRSAEEPFLWLQSFGGPDGAFLVVSPFLVRQDYQPEISEPDLAAAKVQNSSTVLLYKITTLHDHAPATVNFKGPIVINRFTKMANQVVLNYADDDSIDHRIMAY